MAIETEIERLIVRLAGDNRGYNAMLEEAVRRVQEAANKIEQSNRSITIGTVAMGSLIARTIEGVGRILYGLGMDSIRLFAAAESSELRLSAAVEAGGRSAATVMKDYKGFADQIQRLTVLDNNAVMGMLQYAESIGVTGEQAKRAVKNAIALGTAMGREPTSVLRITAALEQGDTSLIARYIRSLRLIKDDTQRVAEAQRMLAVMFKAAEAETKTAAGQMTETRNAVEALKQSFGSLAYQVLAPFLKLTQAVSEQLRGMPPVFKSILVAVGAVPAAITGIMLTIYPFTTALHYTVDAVGKLGIAIAKIRSGLGLLTMGVAAAKTAFIALALYGIYKFSEAIYNANPYIQKLNEELAKSEVLSYRLATAQKAAHKEVLRLASTMPREGAYRYLKQELDQAEKELRGKQLRQKELEDELAKGVMVGKQRDRFGVTKETAVAKQQLKEAQKAVEETTDQVSELRTALEQVSPEAADAEIEKELKGFVSTLQLQNATLGQSAERVKAYQFALLATHPVLRNLIQQAYYWIEVNEKQKVVYDANKSLGELNDKLREEIASLTLGADAVTLWKLAVAGANPNAIRFAQNLMEIKKGLEYQKKLTEDAKRVTEKYLTPQQRFNKTWRDLWEMRRWGKLGPEAYARAMDDAKKEMEEAVKVKIHFSNDPSSLRGSAEEARNWWSMMQNRILGPQQPGQWGAPPGGGPVMQPQAVPSEQEVDKSMKDMAGGILRLVQLAEMQAGRQPGLLIQPADFKQG